MFDYGDKVRIKATGEIGIICDTDPLDGKEHYIVDTNPKSYVYENESPLDYLKDCFANEIELIKTEQKYFIDDRVIIPEDIKNMSEKELEIAIEKLEKDLGIHKK